MPNCEDMDGKVALVTGAASGLGQATAVALAKAGANLFLVDIDAKGVEGVAKTATDLGVKAIGHIADLSDPKNCTTAVGTAITAFGRLDALCNVAGVIYFAHTPAMRQVDYDKTIAVNLNAPFHLIQAAIPHLLEVNGAVVNVTSSATFIGEAYCAAYCASKAGLTHMTKALAMEFMHKPIRFNAVAPGGMLTNIGANMKIPDDADQTLIGRFVGLRGLVDVEQVANMVAFLASPAAADYHGACISIDKGITAG